MSWSVNLISEYIVMSVCYEIYVSSIIESFITNSEFYIRTAFPKTKGASLSSDILISWPMPREFFTSLIQSENSHKFEKRFSKIIVKFLCIACSWNISIFPYKPDPPSKIFGHFQGGGSVQNPEPSGACGGLFKKMNFTFHITVKCIDFL